jgi:tetratricopeptide (TPR) repeat protein
MTESVASAQASGTPVNRRVVLCLVGAVLAAAGGLWWEARVRPDISFLPARAPAEWIVYPKPPDSQAPLAADLDGEFRRVFTLAKVPASAVLAVCGLKQCSVMINGASVNLGAPPGHNWKRPRRVEAARFLRPGTNSIAVQVFNRRGPPALWLALTGDGLRVVTDGTWEASWAGAVWQPARLAAEPPVVQPGHPLFGGERAWAALRTCWPWWLLFAAVATAVVLLGGRWFALTRAPGGRLASALLANPALATLAAVVVLWVLLFTHNLPLLPRVLGFDAAAHLEYIQYVQQRGALPLAYEGQAMYHPPLFYACTALVLSALSLPAASDAGAAALRLLALGLGLAHLGFVFAGLRLLFPGATRPQVVGLLLAAFVAPMLGLTHFVTNEPLVSLLVTATLCGGLRALRDEQPSPARHALVGLGLGAALSTKFTAVLAVPFVLGALAWRLAGRGERSPRVWLRTVGVAALVTLLVGGGHYMRVWLHYGKPLVGAWDPASGHDWWQDPGFCTSAYFLRAGRALVAPLFSGFHGFADGVYSTLWADGLCSGAGALEFRPPWNYDLMAAGCWLALGPTLAILIGAALCVARFLRQPTPAWFLLLGPVCAFAVALIHMTLRVPSYAQVKSFYGLFTLLPVCVCGAAGWDWLARRGPRGALVLNVALGLWALNSYASFWIRGGTAATQALLAAGLADEGRYREALSRSAAAWQRDPRNVTAHSFLAKSLAAAGRTNESRQLAERMTQEFPNAAIAWLDLASAFESEGRRDDAIQATRRAITVAPDYPFSYRNLARRLAEQRRHAEVIAAGRAGLRVATTDPTLHALLAAALLTSETAPDAVAEAVRHYRAATQLAPNAVEPMNNLAWLLATHPRDSLRNGAEAVRLAERACRLTGFQHAVLVGTLAAAYAEAGRFSDAVNAARRAQALAQASGNAALAAKNQQLIEQFQAGRPHREAAGPAPAK